MRTRRLFLVLLLLLTAGVAGAVGLVARIDPTPPPAHIAPVATADAQQTPRQEPEPVLRPAPPTLLVHPEADGPAAPLVLERATYAVAIAGLAARTRATLVFRNDLDRVLEGELVVPLPEGALVSGYTLDIGGRQVEGVVVEARQARVAFETETRRRVDPGLVEWVRGSTFRTRVWPIPARGRRTVEIEYVSDLVTPGSGRAALYELPLRFHAPLESLALRIEVHKQGEPPVVAAGLEGLTFLPWARRYVAETTRTHVQPGDDLRVALPDLPRDAIAVERGPEGETFFAIDQQVEVPPLAARRPPERIAVVWDASLSRQEADRERDLRLLTAHLAALGSVTVDVIVLRHVAEPVRRFEVARGDATTLVAFLRDQPCDGATNLSDLRLPAQAAYALVFSDGLSTIGGRTDTSAPLPIYAMSGDPRADHGRLRAWAERSGGAYLPLQQESDAEVIARLGAPVWSLVSVEADPAAAGELQPAGAQAVRGGRVRVTGRLLADRATLTLRYGVPGRAGTIARQVTVHRSPGTSEGAGLAGRLWAQQRLAALVVDADANRDALARLGQRFSIVTPGTSLLVLESLEQYLSHRVTPPASLPELRAAYQAEMQRRDGLQHAKRTGKTEGLVALWSRRVEWWNASYPTVRSDGLRRHRQMAGTVPAGSVSVPGEAPRMMPADAVAPAGPAAESVPERALAALERRAEGLALASGVPAEPGAREVAKTTGGDRGEDRPTAGAIAIAPWNPDTPYLRALERAGRHDAYRVYLAERRGYGSSPAFFLDCADHFVRRGDRALALRILSNVAELKLEDARLLRVLAHRLEQLDALDVAVGLFEDVRRLRPEEPQSLRDLALVLDRRGSATADRAAAAADGRRALALLAELVEADWDGRFPDIEAIALMEANRIASRLERAGERVAWPLDPRLRGLLDVDLRIVLTWDTDQTDMDLWVAEPGGERCFYSHPRTSSGGAISRDFTGGYGPEEYLIRRAVAGDYVIKANFFGSQAQALTGPTVLQATVVTDYGRPNEQRRAITVRLDQARQVVDIGSVRMEPGRAGTEQ